MNFGSIRIHNEAQTAWIDVVPDRGGIITQWNALNRDILYFDPVRFSDPALGFAGGVPILFPICGNLSDDTYTLNGKSFQLKLHGFAHALAWTVISQTKTALDLGLESNPETLSQYPFQFQLRCNYALEGNDLSIRQSIVNRSDRVMPFSIGFHPYFAVADKATVVCDIPATQFLNQSTQAIHSASKPLKLDVLEKLCAACASPKNTALKKQNLAIATKKWLKSTFFPKPLKPAQLDVAFAPMTAQRATLKTADVEISLNYDKRFTTLVLWTVEGQPFVCLEPWSAQRNALNTGIDLLQLDPGHALDTKVKLTVQPLNLQTTVIR